VNFVGKVVEALSIKVFCVICLVFIVYKSMKDEYRLGMALTFEGL
jgi:hypothetical protein